jgi:hypothetical protein
VVSFENLIFRSVAGFFPKWVNRYNFYSQAMFTTHGRVMLTSDDQVVVYKLLG